MSRKSAPDYAGARGPASLADARGRDPRRYQIQRKIDGVYARLELDERGCVARVLSRAGRPISERLHRFTSERIGAPDSVLCGELEAHTEAGRLAAARNPSGLPRVWLFDALEVGGTDLRAQPYRVRRDALLRAHYALHDHDTGLAYRVDKMGQAYDPTSGRWCHHREQGWRRAPVVDQLPPSQAGALWDDYVGSGGEGLVLVALDAPLGGRGAKRKIKPHDALSSVVVHVDDRRAICRSFGREFAVKSQPYMRAGLPVDVAHSGWYADGTPRFARAARIRPDLL